MIPWLVIASLLLGLASLGTSSTTPSCSSVDELGMASYFIENSQISADHEFNSWPATDGRYITDDESICWTGNGGSDFYIDLLAHTIITGIATQGRMDDGNQNKRVLTYSIQYSSDGTNYIDYEESSSVKIFDGNTNEGSTIDHTFSNPIIARSIKIIPVTYQSKPSLRVELYGCYTGRTCTEWFDMDTTYQQASGGLFWSSGADALDYHSGRELVSVCYDDTSDQWDCTGSTGVGTDVLDDSAMTASSYSGTNYPYNARFDGAGVWMPNTNDDDEYLLINYGASIYVSGFKSRGDSGGSDQADEFYMTYSTDGSSYSAQTEFSEPQVIDTLYLYQTPMTAQYVKFTMDSWTNNIAFAVEIYGCGSNTPSDPGPGAATTAAGNVQATTSAGNVQDTTPASGTPWASDCGGSKGWTTVNGVDTYCAEISNEVYASCSNALGLESKTIKDARFSASSFQGAFKTYYARLHETRSKKGWRAATDDTNQWIQVDFKKSGIIPLMTGMAIRSRGSNDEWIETFTVSYSSDGSTFTTYQESGSDKVFTGNDAVETVVTITFDTPFVARYFRVSPLTWNGNIGCQLEVYGCWEGMAATEDQIKDAEVDYGFYYITTSTWASVVYGYDSYDDNTLVALDENDHIGAEHITASTEEVANPAIYGQVDFDGCWIPSTVDTEQWLQVDLSAGTVVTEIKLQGHNSNVNKYAATFYVHSSLDETTFTTYAFRGSPVVFTGNDGTGVNNLAVNSFNPPIYGRFLRISPQTWGSAGPAVRAKLMGHRYGATCETIEEDRYGAGVATGYYWYVGVSQLVLCDFDNPYTSCQAYYDAGSTDDGYYFLDPSSGGASAGFLAYCDFTSVGNNNVVMTIVSNDNGGAVEVDLTGGNITESITYFYGDPANVGVLAASSVFCYQYLAYDCYASIIYSGDAAVTWWTDKDGNAMSYWAGNYNQNSGCNCNQGNICGQSGYSCNCDGGGTKWNRDGGWIVDKDVLPVSAIRIADLSNDDEGNYTLGDLYCFTKSGSLPESCYDVSGDGHSTDGKYFILLGSGEYLPVYCDFSSVENAILTRFGHDSTEEMIIDNFNSDARWARDINYDYGATISAVSEVVDGEDACRQYLRYRCELGTLINAGTTNYYRDRDRSRVVPWSGSETNRKCACGMLDSCYDENESCNCDSGSTDTLEDSGWITDRGTLPVTQLRGGGADGSKYGYMKLSKLECFKEESGGTPPESCLAVKDSGYSTAGNYLIDPDGNGGEDPIVVYCDPGFNSTHAEMRVHHDAEARTHVAGFGSAGAYQKMVSYDGILPGQMTALFSLDPDTTFMSCVQNFDYECYGATLIKNGMGWFVDRHGEARTNWATSNTSDSTCSCGVGGTCSSGSEVCNCDANANTWAQDEGDIHDYSASFLPVTQLRFGDTSGGVGSEEAYHTLGELICTLGPRPR